MGVSWHLFSVAAAPTTPPVSQNCVLVGQSSSVAQTSLISDVITLPIKHANNSSCLSRKSVIIDKNFLSIYAIGTETRFNCMFRIIILCQSLVPACTGQHVQICEIVRTVRTSQAVPTVYHRGLNPWKHCGLVGYGDVRAAHG